MGLTRSPITGPAGNVEFLAGFTHGASALPEQRAVQQVFDDR
jgi:hypothetical protein